MNQPAKPTLGASLYAVMALAVGAIGATLGISALVAAHEVAKVQPIHQQGGAGFSLNAPIAAYSLGALFFSFLALLLYTCSLPIKRKQLLAPVSLVTLALLLPAAYLACQILVRLI